MKIGVRRKPKRKVGVRKKATPKARIKRRPSVPRSKAKYIA